MEDKETYIRLSQSLDSLRDVALNEIKLIEKEEMKIRFANFVSGRIVLLLKSIAERQRFEWNLLNPEQAKKLEDQAATLRDSKDSDCPPGFIEVDGICVRL